MGDRSQIAIKQRVTTADPVGPAARVYLYGHYIGRDVFAALQEALSTRSRNDDVEYLTRIIFDRMKGESEGTTGFGIGTVVHGDIEHPVPVVDCDAQIITFEVVRDEGYQAEPIAFERFISLTDPAAYAEGKS